MAKNPYEILGVAKEATGADIKLAYRKLAKQYHPDLNPDKKNADEKFKELNAANDFLADDNKRAAFDRGEIDMDDQPIRQPQNNYRDFAPGPGANRYQSASQDFDLSSFDELFSQFNSQSRGRYANPPSPDTHYSIEIDFLEAAKGAKKRVTMPDGKTIDITIPEGIEDGQKLRLKGQGSQPSGDAFVEIHIRRHPLFTRKGRDITIEVPITLYEGILGGKIQVSTIDGVVDMTVPKHSITDTTLRLKGKGIKNGDQYVKLKLTMPKAIDADLEDAIQKWSETHQYYPRKAMGSAT